MGRAKRRLREEGVVVGFGDGCIFDGLIVRTRREEVCVRKRVCECACEREKGSQSMLLWRGGKDDIYDLLRTWYSNAPHENFFSNVRIYGRCGSDKRDALFKTWEAGNKHFYKILYVKCETAGRTMKCLSLAS